MIIAIVALVLVVSGITAWSSRRGRQIFLKVILALFYAAAIAVMANTYQAATIADERGLPGDSVGWFGGSWLYVIAALVISIVGLHLALIVRKKHQD